MQADVKDAMGEREGTPRTVQLVLDPKTYPRGGREGRHCGDPSPPLGETTMLAGTGVFDGDTPKDPVER